MWYQGFRTIQDSRAFERLPQSSKFENENRIQNSICVEEDKHDMLCFAVSAE